MIHVLVTKGKVPVLNHFQSAAEANGYYRDGIDGVVIANKEDLAKAKEKHKGNDMVLTMLGMVDENTLDGSKCEIDDRGVCIVKLPPEVAEKMAAEKAESKVVKAA